MQFSNNLGAKVSKIWKDSFASGRTVGGRPARLPKGPVNPSRLGATGRERARSYLAEKRPVIALLACRGAKSGVASRRRELLTADGTSPRRRLSLYPIPGVIDGLPTSWPANDKLRLATLAVVSDGTAAIGARLRRSPSPPPVFEFGDFACGADVANRTAAERLIEIPHRDTVDRIAIRNGGFTKIALHPLRITQAEKLNNTLTH
jgi:hypothetical protein